MFGSLISPIHIPVSCMQNTEFAYPTAAHEELVHSVRAFVTELFIETHFKYFFSYSLACQELRVAYSYAFLVPDAVFVIPIISLIFYPLKATPAITIFMKLSLSSQKYLYKI